MALNAVGRWGCWAGIKLCRNPRLLERFQGPKNIVPIRKWLKIPCRICQFALVCAVELNCLALWRLAWIEFGVFLCFDSIRVAFGGIPNAAGFVIRAAFWRF